MQITCKCWLPGMHVEGAAQLCIETALVMWLRRLGSQGRSASLLCMLSCRTTMQQAL